MARIIYGLTLAALLVSPVLSAPGKFNKVLSVGDAAPVWENLPGTDGKKHSLADLKAKEVVVVVFTCNSCVIASDYEPRLLAFVPTAMAGSTAFMARENSSATPAISAAVAVPLCQFSLPTSQYFTP